MVTASNTTKTKSNEESEMTREELIAENTKLRNELARMILKQSDSNSVVLNCTKPWLTYPLSTIIPMKVSGKTVNMVVNSVRQDFEAVLFKVYVLILDLNDFFYKRLYEAWIAEDGDAIMLKVPETPGFLSQKPMKFLTKKNKQTIPQRETRVDARK